MTKKYTPSFTREDVEIVAKLTKYQGYYTIAQYHVRHRLFNGGWSQPIQRELFERGHAAAILLFDPILHKVVLIEQFRVGSLNTGPHPWLLEIVAGMIESDEVPEQVVRRESKEEAGLEVQDLIHIIDYFATPGASSERVSLYCGRVDASNAGGVYGLADEGEDIRVWVFTTKEVYQLLEEKQINNSLTLIALQWLQLNEQKILAKWHK